MFEREPKMAKAGENPEQMRFPDYPTYKRGKRPRIKHEAAEEEEKFRMRNQYGAEQVFIGEEGKKLRRQSKEEIARVIAEGKARIEESIRKAGK